MLEETNVSGGVGRKGRSEVDKARKMVSVGESWRKEGKRGEKGGEKRGMGVGGERRRASFFISFREHGGQRPLWRILLWRINVCTRVRIRRADMDVRARPIANALIASSRNPG